MSFGFSLGDLITVPSFAWNVYQNCMKSPVEARILASELHALCGLLQTLSDNQRHYLETLADVQILRLLEAYKVCHHVLKDVSLVLSKYSSLSTSNPNAWSRLRWGTEDIPALRLRIVSSTSLLTAIQSSIQCLSQSRIPTIEHKVDQLLSRLDSLSSGASGGVLPVSRSPALFEDQEDSRPLMLTGNDHEQGISTLGQGLHILSLRGMRPVAETYPKRTALESLESQIRLSTAQRAKRKGSSISRFSWASSKLDALPRAAATGNVAKLQTLIDVGHPVDHVDSVHGYTALHNASMSGCISAIKLLLSSGASVSMCDRDGATALHHAAQNGHVDASSLLVQSGSNVNATDNTGHAPLCCALQNGHISVADALLEFGAIMAAVDDQERDT